MSGRRAPAGRTRRARRTWLTSLSLLAGLVLLTVLTVHATTSPTATATATVNAFGDLRPTSAGVSGAPLTVGTRFVVREAGEVVAVRLYRSPDPRDRPVGAVYSESGVELARVDFPTGSGPGWQVARLDEPLRVEPGSSLIAAVHLPGGSYAATNDYPWPVASTALEATTGLYRYGTTLAPPDSSYRATNYFVDLELAPRPGAGGAQAPSAPPTSAPNAGNDASTTPTAPAQDDQLLSLPRIPWDGGPAYWAQFRKARDAGWADPSFFPVGVWWSGVSSADEVAYDKALGLNFYVQLNAATDYRLIERGGMFWVGGPSLRHLSESSPNWVGSFLDDEVDGRFEPPSNAFTQLEKLSAPLDPRKTGRFRYTNYTSSVLSSDRAPADGERFVNDFAEAVSIDQYFYSVPQCDWKASWSRYIVAVPKATCRTSHSYGLMMDALATRDAADGRRQPLFNFVENASPNGSEDGYHDVDADQVQGAAMASLIHGARGIVWFNQQFVGSCPSGNYFRRAQHEPEGCAAANTEGARTINRLVGRLAPVLNTQSYRWSFGPGLDTMLKVEGGKAYVFAMTDGTAGRRTFTLPKGVSGTKVEVVGEGRSIELDGRTFSDDFAKESTYHVYTIPVEH